jgi:hypothetical protein
MRILVTGAPGSFGSRAARSVLTHVPATDLVPMSRQLEPLVALPQAGCEVHYGDPDESDGRGRAAVTSNDVRSLIGRAPKPFRVGVGDRADRLRQIFVG